jgi:hypothetical protein
MEGVWRFMSNMKKSTKKKVRLSGPDIFVYLLFASFFSVNSVSSVVKQVFG